MNNIIKNLAIFVAGGYTMACLLGHGLVSETKRPYEGAVLVDNDEFKVTRIGEKKGSKLDIATIMYKNHE